MKGKGAAAGTWFAKGEKQSSQDRGVTGKKKKKEKLAMGWLIIVCGEEGERIRVAAAEERGGGAQHMESKRGLGNYLRIYRRRTFSLLLRAGKAREPASCFMEKGDTDATLALARG